MARARRSGASEVHDLALGIEGQTFAGLYRLFHPGVGRVAGRVQNPVQAHDVTSFQGLDVLYGEWCMKVDRLGGHSSIEAVRWEWQSRLTATGKAAMWVGKLSTWTASAV